MTDSPALPETIGLEVPTVCWSDIGGLDDAIARLREGAELPLRNPEVFKRLGIRPARGFLLYGPPGTGKALLAAALAKEAGASLITVRAADMLSTHRGDSPHFLAQVFDRARNAAPCVVFIDEIEGLAPARGTAGLVESTVVLRLITTLIAQLDSIGPDERLVVIAATSRPGALDPALLRPGRLDELVYAGLPDAKGRALILQRLTAQMPLGKSVDPAKLADQTDRFTGADLEDLVRRSGLAALRRGGESVKTVEHEDFAAAMAETRATVTADMEAEYTKLKGELKKQAAAVSPVGFLAPGMVAPIHDSKHGQAL